MKLLFFSLHDDGAIEFAVLCQAAGIGLDIAGTTNKFIRAKTKPEKQIELRRLGAGAPSDDEISQTIRSGGYAGIIVGLPDQVVALRNRLQSLDVRTPMLVRHCGNQLAELKSLQVENFLTPSPRALEMMQPCHALLKPKLLDWEQLPGVSHAPGQRRGLATYVHAIERSWPQAWSKLVELNRLMSPDVVAHYGMESPYGIVDDLQTMARCRATVHLKDSGICCFAVLRSLAVGTPVVMDEETWERCFCDGLAGVIVKPTIPEVAEELKRLIGDDVYWTTASQAAYNFVRAYASPTPELGRAMRTFVSTCVPSLPVTERIRIPIHGSVEAEPLSGAPKRSLLRAAQSVLDHEFWMQRLLRAHGVLESGARQAGQRWRQLVVGRKIHGPRAVRCHIGGCPVLLPADLAEGGLENWELEPIRRMQAWLAGRSGPLVIDVGCSTGRYSSIALSSCPTATVVAIDSDVPSLAATRRACALAKNASRRLVCVYGFVTEEPESALDYVQHGQRTVTRLRERGASGDRQQVRYRLLGSAADNGSVPHFSLDSLFWERIQTSDVLIKCDVEGAELHVLRGARRLLKSIRPTLLLSVHPRHLPRYQHTTDEIATCLERAGYCIEHLPEDHEQHWLCKPVERLSPTGGTLL